jgi:hypothetical protein
MISWAVQSFPKPNSFPLNGTAQHLHEQLVSINPKYDPNFDTTVLAHKQEDILRNAIAAERATVFPPPIERRIVEWPYAKDEVGVRENAFPGDDQALNCQPDFFKHTNLVHIINGIEYLGKVRGVPTNGPGPGNCGRVSCSSNSAIWWCNDVSRIFLFFFFSFLQSLKTQPFVGFLLRQKYKKNKCCYAVYLYIKWGGPGITY